MRFAAGHSLPATRAAPGEPQRFPASRQGPVCIDALHARAELVHRAGRADSRRPECRRGVRQWPARQARSRTGKRLLAHRQLHDPPVDHCAGVFESRQCTFQCHAAVRRSSHPLSHQRPRQIRQPVPLFPASVRRSSAPDRRPRYVQDIPYGPPIRLRIASGVSDKQDNRAHLTRNRRKPGKQCARCKKLTPLVFSAITLS